MDEFITHNTRYKTFNPKVWTFGSGKTLNTILIEKREKSALIPKYWRNSRLLPDESFVFGFLQLSARSSGKTIFVLSNTFETKELGNDCSPPWILLVISLVLETSRSTYIFPFLFFLSDFSKRSTKWNFKLQTRSVG